VAFLPAARLEEGLVPGLTLTEHVILAEAASGFFINWEKGTPVDAGAHSDFNVRDTNQTRVESLSGGTQQRALLCSAAEHH